MSNMSKWTEVALKNRPEVKRVILAADRGYKRHTAQVIECEQVELQGTYWDGGSRYTYTAVDMATGVSRGAPQYNPPQFGGPQISPMVTIPDGVAIVKTGHFCGKVAQAYVYINSSNVTKLLPGV